MSDPAKSHEGMGYDTFMSRRQRSEFERMRSDADLEGEIRMLRHMIGRLSPDYDANHAAIGRLVSVLCRVLTLQINQKGGEREVRDALERAGDMVLRLMEPGIDRDAEVSPAPDPAHDSS